MAVINWGSMIYRIQGRIGAVNIYNTVSGPALRLRGNSSHRPTSTSSLLRLIHASASAQWSHLTAGQVSAWDTYAQSLDRVNPVNGRHYTPSARTAYMELATVYMRLNPGAFPPVTPPSSPFSGDSVTITITGSVPYIQWVANHANASDVTTELLLHRLTGRNEKKNPKRLGVAGFVVFGPGGLLAQVRAPFTAMYHTGYRFIRTSTGQMSPVVLGPNIEIFL